MVYLRKQIPISRYGSILIIIVAAISVFYFHQGPDNEIYIDAERHDQLVGSQKIFLNNGYIKRPIAEFEPVDGLLLAWPPQRLQNKQGTEKKVLRLYYRNYEKFLLTFISEVQRTQSAKFIFEIAVSNDAQRRLLQKKLSNFSHPINPDTIKFMIIPVDTNWIRDFSPIFIQNRSLSSGSHNPGTMELVSTADMQAFSFHYGLNRTDDIDFAERYCDLKGITSSTIALKMEKGNYMTDGRGTCFLGDNILTQNSHLDRTAIESEFRAKLGCRKIIFLKSNTFDVTGGHIDFMAKIVKPDTILVNRLTSGKPREIAKLFDQNAELLISHGFRVIRIPSGVFKIKNRLFFPNYANSLFVNGVVYMPVYSSGSNYMGMSQNHDQLAQRIYESFAYRVVPIDATVFIFFRGSIHCTTSEIPKL